MLPTARNDNECRSAPQTTAGELAALTRTAIPIALVSLVNLGMSITDTILMADLDPRALTAGVVVGDIYSIVIQFAAGALGAVAAPVAAAFAAGDGPRAAGTIADGLRLALVLAVLGSAVILLAPHALLAGGVDLPLPEVATEYAAYMAATYAVMMVVALSRSIFPAFGSGGMVLAVMLAAVPLNLVADIALMHGRWGLPAMGMAGAGAASLLVALFMAAALLAYLAMAPRLRGIGISRAVIARGGRFVAPALARAALFTGGTALCETGVYLSSTVVVAFVAIEAVPAHILVFRTVAVTYVIGTGFAQAVTIHLARHIEAGADALHLTRAALVGTGILGLIFLGAMLALPLSRGLTGIDSGLLADLTPWGAVAVCNLVPAVVAFGILRARADVAVPSLISLIGYWGVGFGLIVLLSGPLGYGVVGIWAGLSIGTTATAAGLWLYLRRRNPTGRQVRRTV